MRVEAAALVFEVSDFESCEAIVRQFFRESPSAKIVKVALWTRDLKPIGTRIWRILDGNVEAMIDIAVGFIMIQPPGLVIISV